MAKDATVNGGGEDSGDNTPIDSGVACACDVTANVCDQACACDSACNNPMPDAGGNLDAQGPGPDSGNNPPPDSGVRPDSGVGPFDGGVLMGDSFNPQQHAQQYAQAVCAFQTRCEPALFAYTGTNEGQCVTDVTQALLQNWTAFAQVVSAGRSAFNQSIFNTCVASFGSADCITGPPAGACEGLFQGNRPEGVACGASIECGSGMWCALTALGGCGTCTRFAAAGTSCAANLCEPNAECFDVGGSPTCVRVDAAQNAPCGTVQDGLCAGRLQCVGPEMGPFTCTRPAALNQTCDPMLTAGPDCNIYQNQVCNAAGTCVAANWVGAGQTCNDTSLCNSEGRCDQATTMCAAWPGAGQTCFQGNCADDLYCDQAGTCQNTAGAGQTCQDSDQCAAGYCINSSCGPLQVQACN